MFETETEITLLFFNINTEGCRWTVTIRYCLSIKPITPSRRFTYVNDCYIPPSMSSGEMKNGKHCHDNSHAQEDREREKKLAKKRLYIVSAVCLVFMVGEILGVWPFLLIGCNACFKDRWWINMSGLCIGGYFAGSLAVMTDAAHLLVDLTSFIISLCSLWLSSRPATRTLNYGWHRAGKLLSGGPKTPPSLDTWK